jgi:hypothetical protein
VSPAKLTHVMPCKTLNIKMPLAMPTQAAATSLSGAAGLATVPATLKSAGRGPHAGCCTDAVEATGRVAEAGWVQTQQLHAPPQLAARGPVALLARPAAW